MMSGRLTKLLLLGLLCLLAVAAVVRADIVPDDDVDDIDVEDMMPEDTFEVPRAPFYCRAIFPNSTSPIFPRLPVGSKADAVIAYQNNDEVSAHNVLLTMAYLQPAHNYGNVIQNFSVVRQARAVPAGETVTFQYTFTPDASLEPGDYNLVVGVYYMDTATNKTFFAPAFNSTVAIDEALGTDPRTVLTYLTLFIIVASVGYYFADRFGLIKMVKSAKKHQRKVAERSENWVEVGTQGDGYDLSYISAEHRRVRDEVMSPSPKGRKVSASPKKKK